MTGQRMNTERGNLMDDEAKAEPQGGDLRGLLERWRELEPDRCAAGDFVRVGWVWFGVLAAVIEAIEARKWSWSLHGPSKSKPEHEAIIYLRQGESRPPWKFKRGANATEALLTAYLAAVEASA